MGQVRHGSATATFNDAAMQACLALKALFGLPFVRCSMVHHAAYFVPQDAQDLAVSTISCNSDAFRALQRYARGP